MRTRISSAWEYRHCLLLAALFVWLNSVDAQLTSLAQYGVQAAGYPGVTVEANPFMQPFIDSPAFAAKGMIGLGMIGGLAWFRRFSPARLLRWLVFLCIVFVGIVVWNLHSLGIIL